MTPGAIGNPIAPGLLFQLRGVTLPASAAYTGYMRYIKSALRYLLGVLFIFAGWMHFAKPGFYLPMMPEYLPFHEALVFLSGVAEILAGILVIIPRTQRIGGWAIIAVLIAVYPANVHMAVHADKFKDVASATALYWRLPMQIIPIVWAYWYTRKPVTTAPQLEETKA